MISNHVRSWIFYRWVLRKECKIHQLLKKISYAAADGAVFIAICGGFSLLLHAGLLQGRTATAPRPLLDFFKEHEAGVTWVDRRWVNGQGLWTIGAALHGVDLVAEFARSTWSDGDRGRLVRWLLEFGGWNVGRTMEYAAGSRVTMQSLANNYIVFKQT